MARLENNARTKRLNLLVSELAASLRPTGRAGEVLATILNEAREACAHFESRDREVALDYIARWVAIETMKIAMKGVVLPSTRDIARSPGELGAMYLARSEPEFKYAELTGAITQVAVEKSKEAAAVLDTDPNGMARELSLIVDTTFYLALLGHVQTLRHKYIRYT